MNNSLSIIIRVDIIRVLGVILSSDLRISWP